MITDRPCPTPAPDSIPVHIAVAHPVIGSTHLVAGIHHHRDGAAVLVASAWSDDRDASRQIAIGLGAATYTALLLAA